MYKAILLSALFSISSFGSMEMYNFQSDKSQFEMCARDIVVGKNITAANRKNIKVIARECDREFYSLIRLGRELGYSDLKLAKLTENSVKRIIQKRKQALEEKSEAIESILNLL